MTPVTLLIDRAFPGVGRLKKASGTTVPAVRKKMNRMLTELYETGRLDLLRDIRDNRLTPMEALDAWNRKALDSLATGATAQKLATSMQKWIDKQVAGVDYSAKHIKSLRTSLGYLLGVKPGSVVNDLPALLESLRDTLGAKHARSFNLARSNAMSYIRATLKRSHPLYLAIQAVEKRPEPKAAPRPDITVEWMRGMFPSRSDRVADAAWSMALTGMGPSEYWGRWEVLADRVRVYGTKREARHRDVPLIVAPTSPRISSDNFLRKITALTDGRIAPYDFRRTFSRWMESAGVTRIRRKMYMGHATGDVTELYERHELDAYLASDAKQIRQYLRLNEPAPTTLRQVK